ncbi:DNA-binding transcriptional LysR family regulator [Hamadaea flava]|uniref:LysR family transcriptional regulator n=1 Tax=Hamadaea flava TaxID=1742688 RepID=A0ABV8LSU2_9ACTN|nr:LysR family transcriptional regulator [Hamadaea flava]MCP2327051.1 DNA-binding transcriptional LysR family regulator [Hamadaea flava]
MELRDIEIFLTLAEELHFGRTAARLHVTVSRVSQAIKKQERLIGGPLFVRTSRTVTLTPLGVQLRADLALVHHELRATMQRAKMAARGLTGVLRVGLIPDVAHDLMPAWEAFRARHPDCRLEIRFNSFVDPFTALRSGQIEALIAWLPVEEPDLTVGAVVFSEPRVLAVSAAGTLAGRSEVTQEILGDGHLVATGQPHIPDYWEDAYTPYATPRGRLVDNRQYVTGFEEILRLVSAGQMIHPLGAHAARFYSRPDITYLAIRDAPSLRWGLVWREENPHVHTLDRIFRNLGTLTR